MVAAVKKQLIVFTFSSLSKSFKRDKAIALPDVAKMLALRESHAVVGTASAIYLLDTDGNKLQEVQLGTTVVEPLGTIQLENEFLLAYSNKCSFVDFTGQVSRTYQIHWNTFPHSVSTTQFYFVSFALPCRKPYSYSALVYVFPYVIGIMRDSAEVRTLLNGRLVQTFLLQSTTLLSSTSRPVVSPLYVAANSDVGAGQIHRLTVNSA